MSCCSSRININVTVFIFLLQSFYGQETLRPVFYCRDTPFLFADYSSKCKMVPNRPKSELVMLTPVS